MHIPNKRKLYVTLRNQCELETTDSSYWQTVCESRMV